MIVAPDETYSVTEVAEILRKSPRHVQRYLKDGLIEGRRPNGPWQVTALAVWKYQGIEQEMMDMWVTFCCRMAQSAEEKNKEESDT